MEHLVTIGWIVLGFLPTLGALLFVERKLAAVKNSRIELGVRK